MNRILRNRYILPVVFLSAALNAGAQDVEATDSEENLTTAAISSVTGDELYKIPTPNLSNMMVGPISGLTLSRIFVR